MATEKITLNIDSRTVTCDRGKTILAAAREAEIQIPTICAHEDLPDYGACRICIVQIEGVPGFPTSCTTPAAEGMVVRTQSPDLVRLRQRTLELMLSGHPNACLSCDERHECAELRAEPGKAGRSTHCGTCSNREECTVRGLALQSDSRELDLRTFYAHDAVNRSDPFMDRDHNLCILCGRCWRICEKIHGSPAISITSRGRWAKIGAAFGRSYLDSGCTFCGACVDICPTGTLTDRYARWHDHGVDGPVSTCTVCPEGCTLRFSLANGRLVATRADSFDRDGRLCAVGRFGYAQIVNDNRRFKRPRMVEENQLVPVRWTEAIPAVAERLGHYRGEGFLAILGESETRETRQVYEQFTWQVMNGRVAYVPANGGCDAIRPASVKADILEGRVRAALVTGDYLDESSADAIEYLVVADFLPSVASEKASAILPVAVLSEVEGTFRNSRGEVTKVRAAAAPYAHARAEWTIVRDLARAMGTEIFAFSGIRDVTASINGDKAPAELGIAPRDNPRELPIHFRGHPIVASVPALDSLGHTGAPVHPRRQADGGYLVVAKNEIVPNVHMIEIEAPNIAKHAKPGQFMILMVDETSERTPLTLIDWDADKGTIRLIVQEVGRSTREVAELTVGDRVAHANGPLGTPYPIESYGTVVLGGGCFGIGAIYPIARALREAGNRVVGVIGASSDYLLYMQDELATVCDELLVATHDGSTEFKGGVQDGFIRLLEMGAQPDRFVAVGCTFMTQQACECTRMLGIPLDVALSPIMVDGTGMCGACRVTVGGETKFGCVDGPFFDGHAVDWEELHARKAAYKQVEVEALPQTATSRADAISISRQNVVRACAGGGHGGAGQS